MLCFHLHIKSSLLVWIYDYSHCNIVRCTLEPKALGSLAVNTVCETVVTVLNRTCQPPGNIKCLKLLVLGCQRVECSTSDTDHEQKEVQRQQPLTTNDVFMHAAAGTS